MGKIQNLLDSAVSKTKEFIHQYKTEKSTQEKMSTKEILSYGLVEFGYGNMNTMVGNNYLQLFMMTVLTMQPMAWGIFLSVIKVIELVRDPIIALIIDNANTKKGRFKPYVMIAAPITAALSTLIFLNPFNGGWQMVAFLYFSYISWGIFASINGTAWGGLVPSLSRSNEERIKFFTLGGVVSALSGAIPGLIPVVFSLAPVLGLELRIVYPVLAVLFGGVGFISVLAVKNLQERIFFRRDPNAFRNAFKGMKAVFKNKYMMLLWMQKFSTLLTSLTWGVAFFVVIYNLGNIFWQTVIWLCSAPAVLFGAFTPRITKKITPRQFAVFFHLLNMAGYGALYFIGYASPWPLIILTFIMSFFGRVSLVCSNSISLAAHDYLEYKTGLRNEATTNMVSGLFDKGLGIINGLVLGIALTSIGFISGSENFQQKATKDWMWMFYTLLLAFGNLITAIPYMFFDLEKEKLKDITSELERRRAA